MKNVRMTIWVMVLMVFCLSLPEAQAVVVFDDGGTHTLDWLVADEVWVQNSPSDWPTTLNLVTGGRITELLSVYNSSQANISDGSIDYGLEAWDYSQISVSGGKIDGGLGAFDNSQVSMSDGTVNEHLYACYSSQVEISGGTVNEHLYALDSSQVEISGGLIVGRLNAWSSSEVSISGGSIGNNLILFDYSQVTIYGSGFNYPLGTLTGSGVLIGTLANGDPINNAFYVYDAARIVLVPEPATLLLLGLGAVMLKRKR